MSHSWPFWPEYGGLYDSKESWGGGEGKGRRGGGLTLPDLLIYPLLGCVSSELQNSLPRQQMMNL
jgi:hypothetical protein